jgi:GNAT superfamily N-acetyltransferase
MGFELSLEIGDGLEEVLGLYRAAGWTEYLKDVEGLRTGIAASLLNVVAREDGLVAGYARVVGDGATVIVIQDLLVRPDCQGRGLARSLVESVLQRYPKVRQRILLCDTVLEPFYKKLGFRNGRELGCSLMMKE